MQAQIYGLYIPFLISLGAFLNLIFCRKETHRDSVYGLAFFVAFLYAVLTPTIEISGWTQQTDIVNKTQLFGIFPVLIWICHYINRKTTPLLDNRISLSWIFMGTFCTLLFADIAISYNSFENFDIRYIGGAGYADALLVVPIYATLFSALINHAYTQKVKIRVK